MVVTVGHSPDADDAYLFFGLASGLVGTQPLIYRHVIKDIESLNHLAIRGALDVTAVSVHAYAYLARRYEVLTVGASMGDGYGPIVVAKEPLSCDQIRRVTVAVPGTLTSAYLALRLAVGMGPFQVLPFDRILGAVSKGEVKAGLLIHEGQLTYSDAGLVRLVDLGQWWTEKTGLPLPLGVIVIRSDLPDAVKRLIFKHLWQSLQVAFQMKREATSYALSFSRGLDEERTQKFVSLYVNERTQDIGESGREAIRQFLLTGAKSGLVPYSQVRFYPEISTG